jgi:hypothetical protein
MFVTGLVSVLFAAINLVEAEQSWKSFPSATDVLEQLPKCAVRFWKITCDLIQRCANCALLCPGGLLDKGRSNFQMRADRRFVYL